MTTKNVFAITTRGYCCHVHRLKYKNSSQYWMKFRYTSGGDVVNAAKEMQENGYEGTFYRIDVRDLRSTWNKIKDDDFSRPINVPQ